jgi:hypothetical protein
MSLVFVHGRAQEMYTQVELTKKWADVLLMGANAARLKCDVDLVRKQIILPYYGTALASFLSDDNQSAKLLAEDETRSKSEDFYQDFRAELQEKLGSSNVEPARLPDDDSRGTSEISIDTLEESERAIYNRKGVVGLARLLDRKSARLSTLTINQLLKDVGIYLSSAAARDKVDAIVVEAIRSSAEPRVIVAHSLGAVVAFRALHSLPDTEVAQLVTIGSPLGVNAVCSRLDLKPFAMWPANLHAWTNAFDPRDIVSLDIPIDRRSLLRQAYATLEVRATSRFDVWNIGDVENPTDNCHGIDGYLCDPIVARIVLEQFGFARECE